ncbi:hypothetical protein KQI52_04205 [bacterium]|nr:hypothetical protein [bacterium]
MFSFVQKSSMVRGLLAALIGMLFAAQADARLYPSDFRWMEFRSGNVLVYYPQGYDSHAKMLALSGHTWIDSLDSWYKTRPNYARIVLNPEKDRSEAMAVINPTRIELPIAPVLDKGIRPQGSLYLDRVTAHELTHVYQMGLRTGISRYLWPVFGEAIAPAALAPDWLLEGQAIWTESVDGGGRLHSSYQSMIMRTQLAQHGKFWPLDRNAVAGRVNPPLNRAYTGGAFLYGSMASEYLGYRHINDLMAEQAAWPGMMDWNFRRAYNGRNVTDHWNAMERAWRDQLRPRMRRLYELGYAVGTRLLEAPRTSYQHPQWTVEGELVVSENSYDRPNRIVMLSQGPEYAERPVAWTGYTAHEGVSPFLEGVIVSEIRRDLWTAEKTESMLVLVTRDGRVSDMAEGGLNGWAPAFHAESMRLAYVGPLEGGGVGLWVAPLGINGKVTGDPVLHMSTILGSINDPAWSRDGKLLAFAADLGDGEAAYVLELAKHKLTRVRIEGANATWDPSFGPGRSLWVSADRDGIFNLYEVDLDSVAAMKRTRVVTGAMEPAVSEDGSRVAYSHYTNDGFSTALLDSSRWLNTATPVFVEPVSVAAFAEQDSLLNPVVFGETWNYSPLSHLKPNYAMPTYANGDEAGVGLSVYGRDPVGLLSWSVSSRFGLESSQPDIAATVTYRDLPVDVSLSVYNYPDEYPEWSRTTDGNGNPVAVRDYVWKRQWDSGLTAYQPLYFDHGPWRTSAVPFAGLTHRMRYIQTTLDSGLESAGYLGVRLGGTVTRYFSAPRDPVPSHLESLRVMAEGNLPGPKLEAELLEISARKHVPGPFPTTVFSFRAAAQIRNGDLDFSRSRVRPRGYSDDSLPTALKANGRMALAGAEFHFPLLYVDRGWPGSGTVFVERLTGSVFADGATGWGGDLSIPDWAEEYGVASFGATVGLHGYLLFQAETQVDVGVAWRTEYQDAAVFVNLSFPELFAFVNDAPDWRDLTRRPARGVGH